MRCAGLVAALMTGTGCARETTRPSAVAFSGDFTLVQADDWVKQQRCDYVVPTDETVCNWGRLTVTPDQLAISVRGYDVHAGLASGPVIHRDSVSFTAAVRLIDPCTVAIDSVGLAPNGVGNLRADTLRFTGHDLSGDSLSWVYAATPLRQPTPCG